MVVTGMNIYLWRKDIRSTREGTDQSANTQQSHDEAFTNTRKLAGRHIPSSTTLSETKFEVVHQKYI